MKTIAAILFTFAIVSGCKKSEPAKSDQGSAGAATDTTATGSGSAVAPHHAHHLHVGVELQTFQDALGDKWHEPKGDQRKKDVCDAATTLASAAGDIAKAPAPASIDATKWSDGGKALVDAVGKLQTACGGTDAAAFEAAFDGVHNSFHTLIGLEGGHHENDGTHQHTM
ncbi:MAG TPA: hypothetical protein VMJ10_00445 [Kofleriaceae bacterium]|nr:hypothetical protein [Kofleriaceae bacterium]